MKLLAKVAAIFDRTIDLLAFVAGILIILMMLAVGSEVVTRYFMNRAIVGVVDVAEILILYITFMAAAWLLKGDGHVKMDLVFNRLKPRAQTSLIIGTSIIAAIICFILFWYGAMVTWDHFQRGIEEVGIMEIPTFAVVLIIPIGGFLLFVQFLRRAYGYWTKSGAPVTKKEMG